MTPRSEPRVRETPAPDGLLVLDKPAGPTSHDIVSRCRWLCATRKVGHAGTLDPMATGVLLVGVGRATRLLTHLVGADKTYSATVRLGEGTHTEDAQGDLLTSPGLEHLGGAAALRPASSMLQEAVSGLTGDIQQAPSAVSAIKVDGRRAHERVRAGEEVTLEARPVTVHSFDLLDARAATGVSGTEVLDLDIKVRVSSGTYVRALARDLGLALGSAGHLVALRREAVGPFTLADATPVGELVEAREGGRPPVETPVLSMGDVARRTLPCVEVSERAARGLRNGSPVPFGEGRGVVAQELSEGRPVGLLDAAGELLAVAVAAGERWQPRTVFAAA